MLFRSRAKIARGQFDDDQKFILVAPDDEILGSGHTDLVSFNELYDMAVAQAPLYLDAGYSPDDEIQVLLTTDDDYGEDHQQLVIEWTLEELMHSVQESAEPNDDELFGSEPALTGAKRLIYNAGRRILHSLEQAWNNPAIQREYKEYQEAGDTDAQFDQVVRICKLPFKQVFVVDTVIREFAGMEGLNDYGWMIEQGEFNDLVDAWQRFRDDADIEHEDWFQRDARDFTGGLR